jgi:hypothetical protein
MKKTVSTNLRLDPDLRTAWNATCAKAGQDSSVVARELFRAAIRYFERNKNLYAPFELVPGPRTPEDRITYTVSAAGGVAINEHGNTVQVEKPAEPTITKRRHR